MTSCRPPILYYKLNSGYSDYTANGYNLTGTNDPTFSTTVPFIPGTGSSGQGDATTYYYSYATSTIPSRQFIQEMYDPISQLSYLNARFFDPVRGQFLSQDPAVVNISDQTLLVDPQQQNHYSYGRNNPLIYKDTGGEKVELFAREVPGIPWARHMYYKLTPNNPNDPGLKLPQGVPQGTEWFTMGAYNDKDVLNKDIGYQGQPEDQRNSDTSRTYKRNYSTILTPPNKGMSDTDFINLLSSEYEKINTGGEYYGLGTLPGFRMANSNNFVYTLGNNAGIGNQIRNFAMFQVTGIVPGSGTSIPTISFLQAVVNEIKGVVSSIQAQVNSLISN